MEAKAQVHLISLIGATTPLVDVHPLIQAHPKASLPLPTRVSSPEHLGRTIPDATDPVWALAAYII